VTDNGDVVERLTPKAAMDALTKVAVTSCRLQDDLELVRLALVGTIHEMIEYQMPLDSLPCQFKRTLDKLAAMYGDAHEVAKLVRDAGVGLYPLISEDDDDDAEEAKS
jgi:hypothetical protein